MTTVSRPPTGTEIALTEIWRQVLKVRSPRAEDNFFELGGDSFRAAQLATVVARRFGVPATPALAGLRRRDVLPGRGGPPGGHCVPHAVHGD